MNSEMEWLRLLVFLPLLAAGRMRAIERRTVERLQQAGARSADRAVHLERGGWFRATVYRRLASSGVLLTAGDDRYYLDERAIEAHRRRRRKRALIILTLMLVALAAVFYFIGPNR